MPGTAPPEALNLHELAGRFRLPAEWIKAQAKAGKLPHLRVGRVTLFNPAAVSAALAEMAAQYPQAKPFDEEAANASR